MRFNPGRYLQFGSILKKKVWKVKDGDFIQVFSKEDQPDDILWD